MNLERLKGIVTITNGSIRIDDMVALKKAMDDLIYEAVFETDDEKKKAYFVLIKEVAKAAGAIPSSIQGLYEEMGRNYPN
ncbi:MAG: aldolase, partial [Thermodesulfovibrionales bacterium]